MICQLYDPWYRGENGRTDGHHHTIFRPVWRQAYNKKRCLQKRHLPLSSFIEIYVARTAKERLRMCWPVDQMPRWQLLFTNLVEKVEYSFPDKFCQNPFSCFPDVEDMKSWLQPVCKVFAPMYWKEQWKHPCTISAFVYDLGSPKPKWIHTVCT